MRIYFTRHGETLWNKLDKIQGHLDSPLTEEGIKMAKKMREEAKRINFDKVYSSDLNRAYETANLIVPDKKIIKTELLREINVGTWSGRDFKDLKKIDPVLYDMYFKNPKKYNRIDGENFYELRDRVKKFFEKYIYNAKDEKVLIVAHGITIVAMLGIIKNTPIEDFWENSIKRNGEFNIVDYKDGNFKIIKLAPYKNSDSI